LLQARKAIDLASSSGILAAKRGSTQLEEEYTRQALGQARDFLTQAEEAYKKDARNPEVIQFARTAAQTAEDARALSLDQARDQRVRQADKLEKEVAKLRQTGAQLPPEEVSPPSVDPAPEQEEKPKDSDRKPFVSPPLATRLERVAAQPAMWFALLGWAVAIVLLFRRRSI
jgi:preprotein translocase subunit SecF